MICPFAPATNTCPKETVSIVGAFRNSAEALTIKCEPSNLILLFEDNAPVSVTNIIVFASRLPTDKLSPDKPPDVLKSPSTVIPPTIVKLVPSHARFASPVNDPPAPVVTTAPEGIVETAAAPNVAPPVSKSNTTSSLGPYFKSPSASSDIL